MNLKVITMIRNEADILPSFLLHLAEFFDGGYILNHRSSDGSSTIISDFCRKFPSFMTYELEFDGYHQKEMSDLFLNRAFEAGSDMVFFQDADEFLDFSGRKAFESACEPFLKNDALGFLTWRNIIPVNFENNERSLEFPMEVYQGPAVEMRKIAIPRTFFLANKGSFLISQGNHSVFFPPPFSPKSEVRYQKICDLWHMPVRSSTQLEMKTAVGAIAYLAKADFRALEGFHWFDVLSLASNARLEPDTLRGIVAHYSKLTEKRSSVKASELKDFGFEITSFQPVMKPTSVDVFSERVPSEQTTVRAVLKALSSFSFESASSGKFEAVDPVGLKPGRVILTSEVSLPEGRSIAQLRGSSLPAEITKLRAPDFEKLQLELSAIQNSKSWKFTLFIRKIYRLLRGR